jgi:hypothetical protein
MLAMSLSDIIVSLLFGIWFLASVLVYVPSLKPHIRTWDLFALIPQWNFFAPRPAQHDFLLLYRDRLQDGSITDWTQVASIAPRKMWTVIWNPWKRDNKAFFDAVTDLAAHVQNSPSTLELSVPYITILNYISGLPRFGPASFTQFLLMRSTLGTKATEPELLFLSNLHSL